MKFLRNYDKLKLYSIVDDDGYDKMLDKKKSTFSESEKNIIFSFLGHFNTDEKKYVSYSIYDTNKPENTKPFDEYSVEDISKIKNNGLTLLDSHIVVFTYTWSLSIEKSEDGWIFGRNYNKMKFKTDCYYKADGIDGLFEFITDFIESKNGYKIEV